MGLAIAVGSLAGNISHSRYSEDAEVVRRDLAIINEHLRKEGLPEHKEPEELPSLHSRADLRSFPYPFLHYLRRVYARAKREADWVLVPVPEGEDPSKDKAVDHEMYMLDSHLLCHSDCEGYYVPMDFSEPLFGKDLPGSQID